MLRGLDIKRLASEAEEKLRKLDMAAEDKSEVEFERARSETLKALFDLRNAVVEKIQWLA